MNSLISICIPSYKQPELLERCLLSVISQTYQTIEILVSDDTSDNSVKIVVEKFLSRANIMYKKNVQPFGSPANWNASLKMAKGKYIVLLHHDDAFARPDSLALFLEPFQEDKTIDFVFARNPTIETLSGGKPFAASFFEKFYRQPDLLLAGNCIGAPSNVMLRSSAAEPYHPKYKWIVDIEFYIRLFRKKKRFAYVDKKLIDIGLHEGQISNTCANNDAVLLLENISYAAENQLRPHNVKVYDFYWRLIRNAGIRSIEQLINITGLSLAEIPVFAKAMINLQKKISASTLRKGAASKILMLIGYLRQRLA